MSLRITVNGMEQLYNSFDSIDYNTLAYGDTINFSIQRQEGFFTNTEVRRHVITSITADEIAEEIRTFALANNIPVPEMTEQRPLFTMGQPMPVEFVGYSRPADETIRAQLHSVMTTTGNYEYETDENGNCIISVNGVELPDAHLTFADNQWTSNTSVEAALSQIGAASNEDIQELRQEMSELREEIERLKMLLLEN